MKRAIILTDGKAGHENQSKAFARALDCEAQIIRVDFRSRLAKMFSYVLSHLGIYTLSLLRLHETIEQSSFQSVGLAIGTGSGTFYAVKALAKKLKVKCAVVLTPSGYDLSSFDCILSPQFDNAPEKANIVKIPVNLVANDKAFYDAGVSDFKKRYDSHDSKHGTKAVAFVIGGPNKCSTMTAEWMRERLEEAFAATPGCEHWVTTSRRTPPEVEAVVDSFPFDYKLIYSRDHFNPIPAFVMLADRLYVTAESTGMISEACSFGNAEVFVFDNLNPGPHKFRRFVESLQHDGYIGSRRKVDLSSQFSRAKQLLGM